MLGHGFPYLYQAFLRNQVTTDRFIKVILSLDFGKSIGQAVRGKPLTFRKPTNKPDIFVIRQFKPEILHNG
jgi:hypothetical protein